MAWEGLSARDVCRELLDPERNGHRNLVQLRDHFAHEALVLWAFSPGNDHAGIARKPPPLTHDEFTEAVRSWVATGAACPD
jgi:hypothetical protein